MIHTRGIIRRRPNGASPAQLAPTSTLQKWLAGGVRIGSGAVASLPATIAPGLGNLAGAAIGGAGESAAEWIEGRPQNPLRIGAEAALGAVPGGWYMKAARPWASAGKSALMSGVGEGMREVSEGGWKSLSPDSILTASMLGGVTGGVLGAWGMPKEAAGAAGPQGLGRLLSHGNPIKQGPRAGMTIPVGEEVASKAVPFGHTTQTVDRNTATGMAESASKNAFGRLVRPAIKKSNDKVKAANLLNTQTQHDIDAGIQEAGQTGLGIRQQVIKDVVGEEKAHTAANKMLAGEQTAAAKAEKARRAEEEIAAAQSGEPVDGNVSERFSTETAAGRKGFTRTWKPEDLQPTKATLGGPIGEAEPDFSALDKWLSRAKPAAQSVDETLEGMDPGLFKQPPTEVSPVRPSSEFPEQANWEPEAVSWMERLAALRQPGERGKGSPAQQMNELKRFMSHNPKMQDSWRGAPVAEVPPTPTGTKYADNLSEVRAANAAATPPSPTPDWVAQQSEGVDAALRAGGEGVGNIDGAPPVPPKKSGATTLGSIMGGADDVAGMISRNPKFALQLGMGVGGAAVGGIADDENPMRGAAIGGTLGYNVANIPTMLKAIGATTHIMDSLSERIKTPEGISQTASEIVRSLPQFQRFSMLSSRTGLFANAAVGPWGSGMVFGIERGLSGDPRGWALVQRLYNPREFLREMHSYSGAGGATDLISSGDMGRAETSTLDNLHPIARKVLQFPGMVMTSGDMAVRKLIQDVGFAEHEARIATMTNEPELKSPHALAELTKGRPLLQMLMPFSRTLANIGEQGALSTPGLGTFLQAKRAVPDAGGLQAVQQLVMTPVAAGLGYEAGKHTDPNTPTSRLVNKFLTNAAGKYSLAAGGGFAAGQAQQAGRSPGATGIIDAFSGALPLPSTAPVTDAVRWVDSGFEGSKTPSGLMPSDLKQLLFPAAPTKTYRLGGIRRRRNTSTGR